MSIVRALGLAFTLGLVASTAVLPAQPYPFRCIPSRIIDTMYAIETGITRKPLTIAFDGSRSTTLRTPR